MVSIIFATLLISAGQDAQPPKMPAMLVPESPRADRDQPTQSQHQKISGLKDRVLAGVLYFVSWGVLVDLDSLASCGAPGMASMPGELLRALKAKKRQERAVPIRSLCYLARMAQTAARIDPKKDGTQCFRRMLGRLRPSYQKALKAALADADPEIRFMAGISLLVLQPEDDQALRVVVAGLQTMRPQRMELLGPMRLANKEIVACLVRALSHKEGSVRRAAARAVIEIGPSAAAAVPALVKLLKTNEAVVEDYCPWPILSQPTRANLAVEALSIIGPAAAPAVPELIKRLPTANDEERREILICLGRMGRAAKQAAPPLRTMLKAGHPQSSLSLGLSEPHLDIGFGAACTLLRVLPGDDEALAVLRHGLHSPDTNLRFLALQACARTGLREKALVPDVIPALKDRELQESAAEALAQVGPDAVAAVPHLLAILMNEQSNYTWYHPAAVALARIGNAGLPALIKIADRRNCAARGAALYSLCTLDGEAHATLPVLIRALGDCESRLPAILALGKLGSHAQDAGFGLLVVYLLDFVIAKGERYTGELLLPLERWALQEVSQ
jgi:HEAT repeat protein